MVSHLREGLFCLFFNIFDKKKQERKKAKRKKSTTDRPRLYQNKHTSRFGYTRLHSSSYSLWLVPSYSAFVARDHAALITAGHTTCVTYATFQRSYYATQIWLRMQRSKGLTTPHNLVTYATLQRFHYGKLHSTGYTGQQHLRIRSIRTGHTTGSLVTPDTSSKEETQDYSADRGWRKGRV